MKKILFVLLAAISFCSCQDDNVAESSGPSQPGNAISIKINVEKTKPLSRSVEDGHPNSSYNPRIYSIAVYAYNSYGVVTEIDLTTKDEIKNAIVGNFFFKDETTATLGGATTDGDALNSGGATIGLPVGTVKVDVAMNNSAEKYADLSTNINYYNHRNDSKEEGGWPAGGGDYFGNNNFDRVFLTTEFYGVGQTLPTNTTIVNGLPTYTMTFKVAPSLARFEIFGGIPVKDEENWSDGRGRYWKKIAKQVWIDKGNKIEDISDGAGGYTQDILEDVDHYLYIPEAYWSGGSQEKAHVYNHGGAGMNPANGTNPGWIASTYYTALTDVQPLKWYPNAFYAVDVEEIFVNNIYVPGPAKESPYLLPWPGFDKEVAEKAGWPHWYKAYHLHGWHTAGYSSTNAFYCMGNMWDRVADADATKGGVLKDVDFNAANITITPVSGTGDFKTTYIVGASKKTASSDYYSTDHNLGIATGKAAAYMIYAQSAKAGATTDRDKLTDLPHVILKVKCYDTKADFIAGNAHATKNFITIPLFETDGVYVTQYKRGTIYRLDLNDLLPSFVGEFPVPDLLDKDKPDVKPIDPVDPDPEMPGSQLIMGVSIVPWTTQSIKPSI